MRKILGSRKAISTILAALLMVVIVVVASVMVYAWSTGLLGSLLVTPTAGKEALNLESATIGGQNPTMNETLYVRNTGSASVSFTTYYVKDSASNTITQSQWGTGPTIQPNNVGLANILIGSACSGCSNPSAFTYTAGNSYYVTVVTSRNNQFVFQFQR